jgi:hypothetical protein
LICAGGSVFSMLGGQARLWHTLLIDEDHLLATLLLREPATETKGKETSPKFMAVVFDRKFKGYYLLDIKDWGPMAIRPTDKALFRFDADAKEIRQVTEDAAKSRDRAVIGYRLQNLQCFVSVTRSALLTTVGWENGKWIKARLTQCTALRKVPKSQQSQTA